MHKILRLSFIALIPESSQIEFKLCGYHYINYIIGVNDLANGDFIENNVS